MSRLVTISVQNATGRLRTLRLEPWARHFVLTPDEKVDVVVQAGPETPGLRVVEATDSTLVYASDVDRAWVVQDGIRHELLPVYESPAPPPRRARPREDPMWDPDVDLVR